MGNNSYERYNFSIKARNVRHFQLYFSYIMVVSFIGGGNWRIRRKPLIFRKSSTNFIYIMLYQVHLAISGDTDTTESILTLELTKEIDDAEGPPGTTCISLGAVVIVW
jgi:hypothetical protein